MPEGVLMGTPKDTVLRDLSAVTNVAQFVSFARSQDGQPQQRHSAVRNFQIDHHFRDLSEAVAVLLENCASVNVRTFSERHQKGNEFLYGLDEPLEVVKAVHRFLSSGLTVIINETINIHDGGVSGVALGELVEFAPGGTPRVVEELGIVQLSRRDADAILATVYGTALELPGETSDRVEFSVHPLRVGFRSQHITVWEVERSSAVSPPPALAWPNRFSELTGDKVFGLLVAHLVCDVPVPHTMVVPRRLPPFSFGCRTGTGDIWQRTSPKRPVPGFYTTTRGWSDPYALVAKEDGDDGILASVVAQEGVDAKFSGAGLFRSDRDFIVEGVRGYGLDFMQGAEPVALPASVTEAVHVTAQKCAARLGGIRFEWVYDGERVWIVQLHLLGSAAADSAVIYPGSASEWIPFDPSAGLEALRGMASEARRLGKGIVVTKPIGVTSHVGDILRAAAVPSKIDASGQW